MKCQYSNSKQFYRISIFRCIARPYPRKLPQTSVIIVFHNEEWFTLLRTIWSVYTSSPRELLKEIVLVDDKSEFSETGASLDKYIKIIPVPIVLVRLPTRSGLTQAKLAGARAAKVCFLSMNSLNRTCMKMIVPGNRDNVYRCSL